MTVLMPRAANKYDALIAGMLEPIDDGNCGENIAYSGKLEQLAAQRAQGDWRAVADSCSQLLTQTTKDLRLAVWWVDAVVHIDGTPILAPTLDMLLRLCERFWPDIHPGIDDDDPDVRLAPFFWLADRLPVTVASVAILHTKDEHAISYADYVNACRLESLNRRDPSAAEKSIAKGALRSAELDQLFANLGRDRLRELLDDLTAGWETAGALTVFLDRQSGAAAPSFGKANEVLGELISVVSGIMDRLQPAEFVVGENTSIDEPTAPLLPAGTPVNRLDAYAQLRVIAKFLRQTEPHSPVPCLLELADRWGSLPIDDLAVEALRLRNEMPMFFELLGWARSEVVEQQIASLAPT